MTNDDIKRAIDTHTFEELAIGFLRYEKIRRVYPRKFREVFYKAQKDDIRFDELVDQIELDKQ